MSVIPVACGLACLVIVTHLLESRSKKKRRRKRKSSAIMTAARWVWSLFKPRHKTKKKAKPKNGSWIYAKQTCKRFAVNAHERYKYWRSAQIFRRELRKLENDGVDFGIEWEHK